ncbi:acid phosphatase [Sphingorhabdus lutea]|uniref:Acid phosphatase n=1 Tax=Sphingorhabdus lutea TaxID=1913578 RepID=A0A1L3JEF3_9SPHN|nr:acid phosphatase [Sphingorhabdus lutea]
MPQGATTVSYIPAPINPPAGQQYLYGSAEASIILRQSWANVADFVVGAARDENAKSVIAEKWEDAASPHFENCGNKPKAAVFDADETLIWNVGSMRYFAENAMEFDPVIWDEWERTGAGKAVAIPGAIDALSKIRGAGIAIIVNTNRSNKNVKGTVDTLKAAGIGEYFHGENLFLRGDTPGGSDKDGRREIIAQKYCVIALVGDQLGDINDRFNDKGLSPKMRKALSDNPAISTLWGKGWFIFPNPIYGPSITGGYGDIYDDETKWTPPKGQ